MDRGLRFGAPDPRGGERREGLPQPLLVAGALRARLEGRAAVALAALARRTRLHVPDLDARELPHDPENTTARQSARQCATVESGSSADQAGQHARRQFQEIPANQAILSRSGCPRQESNLRTRFRKPLLYPLSYGGVSAQPCGFVDGRACKSLYRPPRVESRATGARLRPLSTAHSSAVATTITPQIGETLGWIGFGTSRSVQPRFTTCSSHASLAIRAAP